MIWLLFIPFFTMKKVNDFSVHENHFFWTHSKIFWKKIKWRINGHFHKYEAVLRTLEKLRKTIFCYKMINFCTKGVKYSGNMCFSYLERLALAKVEKVLSLQRNDKKVALLLIYHISGFKESILKNYQINR